MRIEEPVLVDTSAIVELANPHSSAHAACVATFDALPFSKVYLCWPVITEAIYMLRRDSREVDRLISALNKKVFVLLGLSHVDLAEMRNVMRHYHDQEVDLADAALVHLANREKIRAIFTLDRRHFRLFTRSDGSAFRLLPDDFDA